MRERNPRGQGGSLRTALIEAALRLLAADGGSGFSLRAAAREAGIAAPSVYRHFPDRDRLRLAAIGVLFEEVSGLADLAEAALPGGSAWERLLAVCAVPVRFAAVRPGHHAALFAGGADGDPGGNAFGTPLLGRMTALVREILAAAGRMEDPARLALLLWLGIQGVVSQRIARPGADWPDAEELVRQLARRLVRPDG